MNDWVNRDHVVLTLFSNVERVKYKGFFGQVITPRGQIVCKQNWRCYLACSVLCVVRLCVVRHVCVGGVPCGGVCERCGVWCVCGVCVLCVFCV